MGNPASIDQDTAGFALSIQVGVEWRNDVNSLFVTVDFINLDFLCVIEDASNFNGLH